MKRGKKGLKIGFTTGSASAGGAKAGVLCLGGLKVPEELDIPRPDKGRIMVPIHEVSSNGVRAKAVVIKDGGDDPDVTHGARIITTVELDPMGQDGEITIKGGEGVGIVKKPGLPVPVGAYAINPGPMKQIRMAVLEGMKEAGLKGAVRVTVEVPDGKRIALKTMNPKLGIEGGISILGTRGTVIPFSHEAYKETITLSLDVARAQGYERVAFSTGGKSEKLLRAQINDMPNECFIQVGDYFEFSIKEAVKRGFRHIIYGCFFGKLIKMAQGIPYTHARSAGIDFGFLERICLEEGMEKEFAGLISCSNTSREALSIINRSDKKEQIILRLITDAIRNARAFSEGRAEFQYFLFSAEGNLLGQL